MVRLKTVGIRELKNRLSEFLREVQLGTTVLVTDRGTVVAEIREPESGRAAPVYQTAMESWVDQGKIHPPTGARAPLRPTGVNLPDGTSLSILDQERGA